MTQDDIQAVIDKLPTLGAFGLGLYLAGRDMDRDREELLRSTERCTRVCEWLADLKPTKYVSGIYGSYGLKHIAEEEIGYITNGVFIASAVHCGFPFQPYRNSPNVAFGISAKSIKAKEAANRVREKRL